MKLKKKNYIYIVTAVLILIILGVIVVWGKGPKSSEIPKDSNASKEETFQKVTQKEVLIENDQIVLVMDAMTTHFTVLDKESGEMYHSSQKIGKKEESGRYQSELIIDYYDQNSMLRTMYSQDNSVEFESFEIEASEDAIRVNYDIRKNKEDIFVPAVFTKDTFEEEVLGKLVAGKQRRLNIYYKLRTAEKDKDFLADYPELANQDLYIIIDSMNTNDYLEVTSYFEEVGYTRDDYADDTQNMDVSVVTVEMPAQFVVPVEYKLTEDGFTAKVLVDKVESESAGYTLTNVHLLPNFGSITEQKEGYLFVPDGSGGIISFLKQTDATYSQMVYGTDLAVDTQQSLQLTEKAVLPVFGMNRGDSGFFAVIENAAESATINGQVQGATNLSSGIYSEFLINTYDTADAAISAIGGRSAFNLYAKKPISESPKVRYVMLGEDNCDYSSMAKYYQKYLQDKDVLAERLANPQSLLYLDFTGYVTQEATLLGLPYQKKVTLSTLDNIEESINSLNEEGLSGINVRLKGYSHEGINHSIMDSFKLESNVGSINELKQMGNTLKEQNGLLYLEQSADKVYKDNLTDGFRKLTHAARKVNRMVVVRGDYDMVTQDLKKIYNRCYSVSPRYYSSIIKSFVNSAEDKLGQTNNYGYSWSNFGNELTGDYNVSKVVDRIQARKLGENAISQADGFASTMTEGGNIYAIAYTDTLLNVPLSGSAYQSVTESVPFYQMVLHGYRNLAGAPLNQVTDSETEWLRTIESGASMYYSCMTEDYTQLKDLTYRQTLYPITEELSHDEIVNRYKEYKELFSAIVDQTIVKHEITDEGLHLTTYEDGTTVAVNYNQHAVSWGNSTVDARSYAVQ